MSAAVELAAWLTVVGLLIGYALGSWQEERHLARADRQYMSRTAKAVAAVRREATDAGYRHGYGDGYAKASDDAKGHVRGHMHVVAGGEPS